MTSAGPSGGPVALQRLGRSFAPLSVRLRCSSAREGTINGFVSFHLRVDTGNWCVGRQGDGFVTSKSVVSCGGTAGPQYQLIPLWHRGLRVGTGGTLVISGDDSVQCTQSKM